MGLLLLLLQCTPMVRSEACGGPPGGLCRVAGPATPAHQAEWLEALKADRNATLRRIGWTGGVFDVPELRWSTRAFLAPQVHTFDRFLWNRTRREWTVQHFLGDLRTRYGGPDAILLWGTYPNLGADDRNQWDLYRAMPGGLPSLVDAVRELHRSNVSVLLPYLFWDTGTRREPGGASDAETAVSFLKQTGARGVNGDSLPFVPRAFFDEGVRRDYPIALQAEGGARDEALNWRAARRAFAPGRGPRLTLA